MKPVLKKESSDEAYNQSVAVLTKLMSASWDDQVLLSEDRNYDFDFLVTILLYWKKTKENPMNKTPANTKKPSKQELKKDITDAATKHEEKPTPKPDFKIATNSVDQPIVNALDAKTETLAKVKQTTDQTKIISPSEKKPETETQKQDTIRPEDRKPEISNSMSEHEF